MRIVLANAGAQRGFLLLPDGDRWVVGAAMSADPDEVRVGGDLPAEAAELAGAVVRYVAHSREAVLLGDAAREGRFTDDPYIATRKTRSILCLPLLQQGRLSSILYLENDAAPDAFTPERAELLQLLSTQAATAVENARLYADLQRAHANLQRSNEALKSTRWKSARGICAPPPRSYGAPTSTSPGAPISYARRRASPA